MKGHVFAEFSSKRFCTALIEKSVYKFVMAVCSFCVWMYSEAVSVKGVLVEQCQDKTGSWLPEHAPACEHQCNSSAQFLKTARKLWSHACFPLHLPRVLPAPVTDDYLLTFPPAFTGWAVPQIASAKKQTKGPSDPNSTPF